MLERVAGDPAFLTHTYGKTPMIWSIRAGVGNRVVDWNSPETVTSAVVPES